MALSSEQKEQIRALVSVGDLSNVQIGDEVGTSEKTVRNLIAKEGLVKSEIKDLVKREITNTIIGNEIKSEKSELSPKQKEAYDEVLITMSQSMNLFNNATIDNQLLVNQAQDHIKQAVEDNPEMILDHLPNLMAAGKMTETNRKQLLGLTEPYKAPKEDANNDEPTTVVYVEDTKGA